MNIGERPPKHNMKAQLVEKFALLWTLLCKIFTYAWRLPIMMIDAWQYATIIFKPRFRCTVSSTQRISRADLSFLLSILSCAILCIVQNWINQWGNVRQHQLSLVHDFDKLLPLIRDETAILVLYALIFLMIWTMQPIYRAIFITIWLGVPIYYIPDLRGNMSGIDFTCGGFKMPLLLATTISAVVLCYIFICLLLYVNYRMSLYVSPEAPITPQPDDTDDQLVKNFLGGNTSEN